MNRIRLRDRTVYPAETDRVLVIYPGTFETRNGPYQRYRRIAESLTRQNLAATILCPWPWTGLVQPWRFTASLLDGLRKQLDYAAANAGTITGTRNPEIAVLGFSAGAGAAAAVAHEYPSVKVVMLVSPSCDASRNKVLDGISTYQGQLHQFYGQYDLIGKPTSQLIDEHATQTSAKYRIEVRNGFHGFHGKEKREYFEMIPEMILADRHIPFTNDYSRNMAGSNAPGWCHVP